MGKSPVRTGGGHAAAKVVLPAVAIAIGVHSGPAVLATLCAGFLWNLLYVRYFAPLYDRKARLKFVALSWCRDIIVVAVRYFIVCNGHHGSPLAWLFLLPLGVFETHTTQWLADWYERRPMKHITAHQVLKQIPVACTEAFGLSIGFRVFNMAPGGPSPAALLDVVWRAPLFDVGLDLGFYTLHRTCHKNKKLYRWIHAEHHTDVAKEYGILVAHETYSISTIEALSILASYLIGFELIGAVKPYTLFDMACLVSWAHTVELLGHTELTWSPSGHPMRIVAETLHLEMKATEHTVHHSKPLTNFSKRLTLFDRLFGTYEPPPPAASKQANSWEAACERMSRRLGGAAG